MSANNLDPKQKAEMVRLTAIIAGLITKFHALLVARAWKLTGGNDAEELVQRVWVKLCDKTLGQIALGKDPAIEVKAVKRNDVTIDNLNARDYLCNGVKFEAKAFWKDQKRKNRNFLSANGSEDADPRDAITEVAAPETDSNPLSILVREESEQHHAEAHRGEWQSAVVAVNSLSETLRPAFILKGLGFDYGEIEELLGVKAATARKRVHDAYVILRDAEPISAYLSIK